MKTLQCLLLKNDCYAKYHGVRFKPVGIVVHATDPAGRVLSRFVQPAAGQTEGLMINGKAVSETEMMAALGKNRYGNHWNRPGVQACVHAFLGELADGSLAVCQTLDWTQPCWGAGSGKNGSYNGCLDGKAEEPLYVQFEMIEDPEGATDPAYCKKVTQLAVEFCVYLMRMFPSIKLENVVSHKEAHGRGCATDHGDPESWWKRRGTGMAMDKFRALIVEEQAKPDPDAPTAPHHPFADVPDDCWSAAYIQAAWEMGLMNGVTETEFRRKNPMTREQAAALAVRICGIYDQKIAELEARLK